MRVNFHPAARAEFREAAHYYEGEQPGLGRRFTDAVETALQRIAQNPLLFRVVFEDVRKCRVLRFPYGLLYQLRTDYVRVVGVMHLHRDPDYWKSRV